ncbi:efflux RND transporter periplasmic adaptor subunit [Celeribacter persicus]|uniref:RND family efflux transporter MFP subunit n=1 Tax=Celeribacter persicus TaxID=1651082 RepID=A0A2T5HUV1_9RHOB|nr:HlyD family efflux transporter periplasmic adaptor subunit [Celeribacter persicus]PTQ75360.1 RND family efflux transporter MFP subunit [Celeribacter persicus]
MATRSRSAAGLAILGATLALTLTAGGLLYQAATGPKATAATRSPKERAYAVEVATLTAETLTPVITAYGRLEAAHTLELRSAVAGTLVDLPESFRNGGQVAAGDLLYRIDPAKLQSAYELAETDVAEAEANLNEMRATLELSRLEARAAEEQRDLRTQAYARQLDLRERGVATAAELETASLARAAAEQTLINRQQVVAGDEAQLAQADILLNRARIALKEAERALSDTEMRAPFAGVLSDVTALPGGLVSANEQLGVLVDPSQIEVAFRLTGNQYARLLNDAGTLRKAEITTVIQRGRQETEIPAKLDRAAIALDDGQVGRLVYARLTDPDPRLVQPGDFVSLRIPEKPLSNVALIPASAVTTDGRMLLIGENNRLEEITITPLRHQGDELIVSDVPFGQQYVTARALQLGPGIVVTPVAPALATETAPSATPAAAAPAPAADTIALDDTRRAAIVAFIEASEKMKPEKKEQFLEELSRPDVPRATVEKFEAMIAEGQ